MVQEVSSTQFPVEVLGIKEPTLVDFWAPWCGPCRIQAPILEDFAAKVKGKIQVRKLNTDENGDTAAQYGIRSIPTLILFKDGKEVDRHIGVAQAQELEKWVGAHVKV
ncbi:MAG: thioredoxin [Firmicutes bacterium]|nr:thioredoxin [Bacillota bacterium]